MSEHKFPTEEVELPSKGLVYPPEHPLSSGKVEIKYMTAKEEDILSNQSFINKGTVLDKLLNSLIVTEGVKVDDFIVGDKNAVFIVARVLGYGKEYNVTINGNPETIDLSELQNKPFSEENIPNKGVNEFSYTLESTGDILTYKLLTGKDEKAIDRELAGLKKINKESSPDMTTRLKHMITSINGNEEKKEIRKFVDEYLLARDARAFREHVRKTQPDVNMDYILDSGKEVAIPIGLTFFWPDY
jgi:hypothetical protein|tara:strand:- start:1381 stop:2112 length:732 start_codon:yes stop_codon:yes gene_type:complete